GALSLANNAGLTLSGATGFIASGSSITASAFFGDGTNLSGIMTSAANQAITGIKTFTSTLTVTANAFSVGGASFTIVGSSVGIRTSNPVLGLDVNSPAQFGFGSTKST